MSFWISNGFGDSVEQPSPERMRAFLQALDTADEEHGAAWLATEDDRALEWNVDGRLVFDDRTAVSYLHGVSIEEVVRLWRALAEGDVATVLANPWQSGNGFVRSPEREAELAAWRRDEDRKFFESLGAERVEPRCRRESCMRGAVAQSVFCRAHHFESIRGRPCP